MIGERRCHRCGGPLPRHYPPCEYGRPARTIGALLVAMVVAVALAIGCGKVTVGPFLPTDPVPCDSDAWCPDGQHCAFPGAGTRAICMAGESEIDAPPSSGGARDGEMHSHPVNCVTRNDAGALTYGWCPDAGR